MKSRWTLVGFLCALFVVYTVDCARLIGFAVIAWSALTFGRDRIGRTAI